MIHKNRITALEWFCILISGSLFTVLSYSRFTAGRTDILMYALSQAGFCVIAFPMTFFIKRYYKNNRNGIVLQAGTVGTAFNKFCSAVYGAYFICVSAAEITVGVLFVKLFIDNYLSAFVFSAVIVLCGYISAVRGIHGTAGSSVMFASISGIAVAFVFALLILGADPLNFSYLYSCEAADISDGLVFSLSGGILLPCMLIFRRDTDDKASNAVNVWIAVSFIISLVISVTTYAVVGEYANYAEFPFYTSAQMLESGAFKRLDVIFLVLWMISLYVSVSVMFSSLREVMYMSAESVKAKGYFILGTIIVFVISAAAIDHDALSDLLISRTIITLSLIVTVIILPALFLSKRKSLKRIILPAVLLFCMFMMSGCGKTEIQDRLIIKGIGIDESPSGYSVTVQYTDTLSSSDTQENKCFSASGASLAEAVGNIKNSIGLEPFFGQLSAVAAGYDTAAHMDIITAYFIERSDVKPSVNLFLSETTASDVLSLEKDGQIIPADMLTSVSFEAVSKNDGYTILNYINERIDPTRTPVVPMLKCDDTIRLSSAAVFGAHGIYTLDKDDLTVYKLMSGKIEGSVLSTDNISCRVEKCRQTITGEYDGRSLGFYYNGDMKIVALENPDSISDDEICNIFESYLEQIINYSSQKTMKIEHDDIYGCGRRAFNFDRSEKNADQLYRELLSECKLIPEVRCEISKK